MIRYTRLAAYFAGCAAGRRDHEHLELARRAVR